MLVYILIYYTNINISNILDIFMCRTQLDVGRYTAFAVPKVKGNKYEFVAISNAVSDACYLHY